MGSGQATSRASSRMCPTSFSPSSVLKPVCVGGPSGGQRRCGVVGGRAGRGGVESWVAGRPEAVWSRGWEGGPRRRGLCAALLPTHPAPRAAKAGRANEMKPGQAIPTSAPPAQPASHLLCCPAGLGVALPGILPQNSRLLYAQAACTETHARRPTQPPSYQPTDRGVDVSGRHALRVARGDGPLAAKVHELERRLLRHAALGAQRQALRRQLHLAHDEAVALQAICQGQLGYSQ